MACWLPTVFPTCIASSKTGIDCIGSRIDQVQSEDGERQRETRRVGKLTRFGDAILDCRARGTLASGGDGSGRDGDESRYHLVSVVGGACQLDPATRPVDALVGALGEQVERGGRPKTREVEVHTERSFGVASAGLQCGGSVEA